MTADSDNPYSPPAESDGELTSAAMPAKPSQLRRDRGKIVSDVPCRLPSICVYTGATEGLEPSSTEAIAFPRWTSVLIYSVLLICALLGTAAGITWFKYQTLLLGAPPPQKEFTRIFLNGAVSGAGFGLFVNWGAVWVITRFCRTATIYWWQQSKRARLEVIISVTLAAVLIVGLAVVEFIGPAAIILVVVPVAIMLMLQGPGFFFGSGLPRGLQVYAHESEIELVGLRKEIRQTVVDSNAEPTKHTAQWPEVAGAIGHGIAAFVCVVHLFELVSLSTSYVAGRMASAAVDPLPWWNLVFLIPAPFCAWAAWEEFQKTQGVEVSSERTRAKRMWWPLIVVWLFVAVVTKWDPVNDVLAFSIATLWWSLVILLRFLRLRRLGDSEA